MSKATERSSALLPNDPPMLIFCDHNPAMVRAWTAAFADDAEVEIRLGDLTEVSADAYVSAANSFGEMGGGVDLALRERFGGEIERRVMETISETWGRMPVGEALVVETEDWDVPFLIVAPTMEVPMDVSLTDHAYLALRAVLHVGRAGAAGARKHCQRGRVRTVHRRGRDGPGTSRRPDAARVGRVPTIPVERFRSVGS